MNDNRERALQELYCMEEALKAAKDFVAKGANPQDIMRDFSKTKTSKNWIVVTATMARWWHHTKRKREGE